MEINICIFIFPVSVLEWLSHFLTDFFHVGYYIAKLVVSEFFPLRGVKGLHREQAENESRSNPKRKGNKLCATKPAQHQVWEEYKRVPG